MKRHELKVTITLTGSVLTKSSSPASFGVDAPVARAAVGPEKGTPYLPGTLIKGKIKESLLELGYLKGNVQSLLGNASDEAVSGGSWEPFRGRVIFADVFMARGNRGNSARHRIAVEDALGSVKGEALQVIESPFGAGEAVTFVGAVWVYGEETNASSVKEQILEGLRWATNVGANRTTASRNRQSWRRGVQGESLQ